MRYDQSTLNDETVAGGTPDDVLFDVGETKPILPLSEVPPEQPKPEVPDPTVPMVFDPPLAGATISACGRYRYVLWRKFKNHGVRINWICLNGSKADGERDDPSLNRMISFSKREGAAEIFVTNLFGYRTTYPRDLRAAAQGDFGSEPVDVEGPENRAKIKDVFERSDLCVVGWGSNGSFGRAGRKMMAYLAEINVKNIPILCLGVTKHGHPRHPLYVGRATPLTPFSYRDGAADEGVDL